MTERNPYTPPAASLVEVHRSQRKLLQQVFVALVIMQFLATLRYLSAYFEMVYVGAVPFIAFVLMVPASVCLYIAGTLILFKPSHGKYLFLLAAIGLSLTIPFWRWPSQLSIVAALGAVLGAAGWWIHFRNLQISPSIESPATASEQNTAQRRPIWVFVILVCCILPTVGVGLAISNNWSAFEAQLNSTPFSLAVMLLQPLLLLSGGVLLVFMRRESIVLFVLYFVWGLGNLLLRGAPLLAYLDQALIMGLIIYGLRMNQKGLLR